MRPTLWGPGMWHILFMAAWHGKSVDALYSVMEALLPVLLPCAKCRQNHLRHSAQLKKHRLFAKEVGRDPLSSFALRPRQWFVWVYLLKRAVNKTTGKQDVPFGEVLDRFHAQSGRVDDVLVADTLLMLALEWQGRAQEEEDLISFCRELGKLLPLPSDSILCVNLPAASRPVTEFAYSTYKNTRIQNGIPYLSLRDMSRAVEERAED